MPHRKCIGLIGLGLLGSAMASRLLAAGFDVVGYDLDRSRRLALRRAGGHESASAPELTASCGRILLSLPTTRIVESVLRECRDSLRRATLIIDTTTGDPARTVAMAARLAERGIRYLDATVLGSSAEARRGEVVVFTGGTPASARSARGVLRSFAREVIHAGPCGAAMRMKLIVNLVLGLNRAVLAEGLAFAQASGVAPKLALAALQSGAAYSRVMDAKGPKMVERDFVPQARLAQHYKDVRLILAAGRRRGAKLPLSSLHHRLLKKLVETGRGDLDNSAIIEAFRSEKRWPQARRVNVPT